MKALSKVIFPPLAGFTIIVILFAIVDMVQASQQDSGPGEGLFYFYILPIFLVVALLFQIIVVVVWNQILPNFKQLKTRALIGVVLFCICSATGLGYMLHNTNFGIMDLVIGVSIMFIIQLVYWSVNVLVLYYLDRSLIRNPVPNP